MNKNWQQTREDVITYCIRMQNERLVYYTAGNISARVYNEPDLIAMTPTSMPYDALEPDDICIVTTTGELVDGRRNPTSELPLHTIPYADRPEIGAIVHTHSANAMAMANLGWTLPPILTGLVEACGGGVSTAPYSKPSTDEMAHYTADALKDRGAAFMRFHGLVAIGADLAHAYQAASVTEGACDVYLKLRAIGEVHELPEDEIDFIAQWWREQWAPEASAHH